MAWTADKVKQLRQSSPGQSAKQDEKDGKWTADRVRQVRTTTPASTAPKTEKAQTAKTAAKDSALEKAYEDYRLGNNLGFAAEQQGVQTAKPVTGIGAGVTLGDRYANAAQKLKNSYAEYSQPDAFDKANQWYDQKRNQELVKKMTETKETGTYTSYAQMGTSAGGSADPFRTGNVVKKYSTADLEKMGYSADEIAQARNYLDTMESIPEWKQATRRVANTVGGIADTVASAPLMAGENLVQAVKNVRQSSANRKALAAQVAANPREKNLYDRLMETDMDYQPKYSTGDLLQQGFTRQEIEDMRARIAGTEASEGVDPEKSVGYQLYDRGRQLTGAAQSGLTDVQRTAQGVATSAAENLAVAAVNPAAVLPVLSGQGAADAMAQAMEKGQSAGKTMASGTMKFGAGWAINSVAVADLAKTMGAGTAKDSVAGQIAEWVRKVSSSEALREKYPAVANAVSGGIDNAMQAFVETYADQAIDAALGDSEAAQSLLTRDTFLQALESGLTGGASGALGGAVGTGLAKLNAGDASLLGNAESYAAQADYEKARQAVQEQQRRQALAQEPGQTAQETAEPSQSKPDGFASSPEGGARGGSGEAEADWAKPLSHAARDSSPTEGSGQTVENPGKIVESAGEKSDNAAVRAYAEAVRSDSLTAKTIRLFTPEAGNEANRAAFAEAYGVELPGTAAATRRALRETAAQENAARKAAFAEQQTARTEAGPEGDILTVDGAGDETLDQREGDSSREAGQPSQSAQSAASSPEGRANASAGEAEAETGLRETYGMQEAESRTRQESGTERTLKSWGVSEQAAKEIGQKLPEGTDADRYAAAASTLYRLGQLEDVKSFDQALELAGSGSGMAANVNYVLGSVTGRNALEIAYTYGKDAAGTRWEKSRLGGNLTEQSRTGKGETLYAGTTRSDSDAASRVIELNAAATGTTAVLKSVLRNEAGRPDSRVRAYVDTETGRIFFGDSANDVFGTVLHEDWHWYNALDAEGGQQLMDHALEYLARANGFETVDEMIRGRMDDYAGQGLTYEEAAEELVGDAWRGIFSNESDFKRWVEFQRGQAEKNSGRAGTIRTVMNRVKEMLGGIVSRAKEILSADPENEAARKAQRLAEKERRILQDEYFAHAEKAMENLRSAKENAAALKNESTAEGRNIRFSIQKDADGESYIKIDEDILSGVPREEWKTVVKQAIKERYPNGFERNGWTILNHKDGRSEFVRSKSTMALQRTNEETYADKMRMAANLDEIIKTADEVYREPANHKNAEAFNRGKIKIVVGQNAYEADVLTAFKANDREIFYDIVDIKSTNNKTSMRTHVESKDSRSSLQGGFTEPSGKAHMESEDSGSRGSESSIYQESADTVLKTEEGGERPSFPAKNSIAQENAESKGNSEPVKKSVRFQLAEQADRESRKNVQRQASRAIADNSVMLETLGEMMGITHGVRISQDSIEGLALRWTKTNASKADRVKLAGETRALVEYLKADGADMTKAQSLAETLAGEVLDGATYRNTELWDQYPEFHELSYTVNKDGQAKAELVKRYGSWSEAVAEARRHGVKLRQAEGVRDGNPAEQYESIVNDTRAVGGVKDGAAALFRQAAKKAGVDGAASMESTEWLDILMNVRDAIKPKVMSRFEDVAEYEDAKVELAGRMIGDILNTPEMNDAQAIFDSFQKWQRYAVAAAVGEENVDAALKELRKVQKDQSRDFNRRLYENQRKGSRNEALQKLAEMQVSNAKAEQLLDRNLETLGVDIANSGDLAEKLDLLKEAYERGWKEEKQRLREERQDMIDSIRLENQKLKRENYALSYEVAGEQKRADAAEWQLIHQQNELMEWEDENQRKAQKWQEEQARRNAIAVEAAKESRDRDVAKAREMRDRDIAWAEQVAARRVEIARAGRRKDEYRRIIRNDRAQLNQMILHPSKDRYVQPHLIKQAAAVAQIADMALVNDSTMARLTRLRDSIADEIGKEASPSGMSTDWDNSGIKTMIEALTKSMSDTKEAKLDRLRGQLAEAEALPESDKARDLRASLERRIRETEKQPYQPMTADQLQLLKAITTSTLHVIRTANKTLSQEKAEAVDKIAQDAAEEVIRSKGNGGKLRNALTKYNLDMLGGTRVFRMLGGYTKNGQMEKLGTMLNDGQRRQTEILVEGTHKFDNVTGKDNLKQMEAFAGPGAELVDIGLKDAHGKEVPLTHAQLCSLYMHLRNADSREHLMSGGFTVPNAEAYNRGEIEEAYQKWHTVRIGMLTDSEGKPAAETILDAAEAALTDYDRAWIADMEDFFGNYTTDLINETSMKLLGFRRATVKNYYPIAVDRTALASQIEGVKLDATIEGRGFLKERVKSQKPILLEECSSVVQRSLRDTAAYAGLAPAIRDVQKVLSCGIETVDGIKVLKDGILKEKWGSSAVNYVNDLLTDLQTKQRRRDNGISRAMRKLRGNYAGAILTLNPGVAIAQAASLPTAGAVLGADTMAAVVPFVKNLSGKQRAALEAEIAEHGDALLQYRLRGSRQGELASVGVDRGMVQNAMDKLPKGLTGWITTMDEITVASLWEGAKRYVEHHESLTASDGDSYWTAVNRMYQKVIEETQPNYTTMQRAGIQRNPDELVKSMTMFTTQRFQNYGILADAVMDYNAQHTRYKESRSADAKAELERAGQNLNRAVTSQVVQTAVFALMKIGADFLLHRWDREQDENGDITALSMAKRFAGLYTESAAGNFLYGSELYALVNNVIQGKDYDVVSATNISAVNDLATSVLKLERLLKKDTSEMDEDELKAHHAKVQAAWMSVAEYGLSVKGVPAANVEKIVEAFKGYAGDVEKAAKGEGFSFSSLPASATGQYDRLYNAIQSGDSEEAKAALEKLEAMGKDEKTISAQLKNRLKKYSPEVEQAAKARNAGNDRERQAVTVQLIRELYEAMGIREGVKADADKRAAVIDLVTGAIDQKADSLLAGDKDRTVYSDLTEALDGGRRKDVQDEIDRLRRAGKEDDAIRSKITAAAKEEYLAGNGRDRARIEELLLSLTKADGTAMYEEKTFAQWVSSAEKKAEKEKNTTDEWAGVR